MGYTRQGFEDGMILTHNHLINIENGILEGASLEITNTNETVIKASDSIETYSAYVNPSQKIGSEITWGTHSSSDNSLYSMNIYAGLLSEFIKNHR